MALSTGRAREARRRGSRVTTHRKSNNGNLGGRPSRFRVVRGGEGQWL
jgi:hypothetical protein